MSDVSKYLNVLIEGLQKKNSILERIVACNEKQAEAVAADRGLEEFDRLVDEKAVLIDQINQIDNGFQSVFDRVKQELNDHREAYKEQIHTLQDLIRRMTDLGVAVETGEARNKQAVEQYFAYARKNYNSTRKSAQAASDYYKSMSRMNYIDPQLMDNKQ